ncbi:MAG: PEP-CTERM sorting domain-containing protein [Prevotella sp.]|nr:PEP-CTERM sorting domain-containing protein [Prevotella sp.]
MKKILILAAVIVAGVAANAASFKWSAGNIYASNGTDKFTGDVVLYAYAATADASTAFAVSTVTASSTGAVPATTFSDDRLVGGTTYQFYFMIEDGGKAFTSAEKTGVAAATQTVSLTFGNMASATQNASNWAAVPEPTSGLLMLLGIAGLALKRKRA